MDGATLASPSLHPLLLLSDSALPLGSFAFSSGLESFLAHQKAATTNKHRSSAAVSTAAFETFLEHSIANVASTALPYVRSGWQQPGSLERLDNDFDASTPCTVARRASVAQGRALLAVWERALVGCCSASDSSSNAENALTDESENSPAARHVTVFATAVKISQVDAFGLKPNGHFAPLFGAVARALGLKEPEMTYLFLLNHAKALLSAAVRASVLGPYQSQAVLASLKLQNWIRRGCEGQRCQVEDAAVTAPPMDLWMGRHELLYSRIFNS